MTQSLYVDFLDQALQKLQVQTDLSDLCTWSLEEQKMIYSSAFALYQQKSYEQAEPLFTQLCMTNPFEDAYWRGLASSAQMQSKWDGALHAWCVCALLKDKDPMPHFHAAECFFSMNDKKEAEKALLQAEKRVDATEDLMGLKMKIGLLKELLASR